MRQPVILVSGTPGTGKSRLAQELASSESLHHIDVGEKIRNEGLFDEFDDELDTHIIDDTTVSRSCHPLSLLASCGTIHERKHHFIAALETSFSLEMLKRLVEPKS